jgi:hypothetical protein
MMLANIGTFQKSLMAAGAVQVLTWQLTAVTVLSGAVTAVTQLHVGKVCYTGFGVT